VRHPQEDGAEPRRPAVLTMYCGRLGSRPWYRISAGTCSTSSSPWCQERAHNLTRGANSSWFSPRHSEDTSGSHPVPPYTPNPLFLKNPFLLPSKLQSKPTPPSSPSIPSSTWELHPIPICTLTPESGERKYSSSMCTCTSAIEVYLCCTERRENHTMGPRVPH